jgi:hypothetical protein
VKEGAYRIVPVKGDSYIVGESHTLAVKYSSRPFLNYSTSKNGYFVQYFDTSALITRCKNFSVKKYDGNEEEKKNKAMISAEKYLNDLPYIEQYFSLSVKDYFSKKAIQGQIKTYRVPLNFPDTELDFDPYVLGYWLGDGTSIRPDITTADEEVVEYFTEHMKQYDLLVSQRSNGIAYGITSGKVGNNYKGKNKFLEFLQSYNLVGNKHIPHEFLFTSRQKRLELLAGLLDSDGCLNTNSCYDFIQKRENLLDETLFLVRSLGFAAYKSAEYKTCTNSANGRVTGLYYRCGISGEGIEDIPCKIPRKKASPREQVKDVLVTGIKLQKIETPITTYRVVTDKPKFLMADFTVRHSYRFTIPKRKN